MASTASVHGEQLLRHVLAVKQRWVYSKPDPVQYTDKNFSVRGNAENRTMQRQ